MSRPLEFFSYVGGALSTGGLALGAIAEAVGTPAYVYSAEALLAPLRELQAGLAPIGGLVCFAAKSNSNLAVLSLLARAGAGVDVVSGGELHRAGLAGISGARVVFSGVGKSREEMVQALAFDRGRGILSFNVESEPELRELNAVASAHGAPAPVSLRFNPDVDARTHPYVSTGLKKNKFGISRAEALAIARNSAKYPDIVFEGLSVHIGSQLTSLAPLDDAFGRVRSLAEAMGKLLPRPLARVDLGGGVGVTYGREKVPPLSKYCDLVLKHFGPRRGRAAYRVTVEPGRAISGNAGVLLTRVLYRKTRGAKTFLVVDAAMNDLIRPALYGSYHEIVPVEQSKARGARAGTDVVGPVCESADFLARGRKLPKALGPSDLLAVLSAGAYGFTMASNYNSRPRPPEVLVENGVFRVVRERESYDDLARGEHFQIAPSV